MLIPEERRDLKRRLEIYVARYAGATMESTNAPENLPLSNQRSTILGVTIAFQVAAVLSVLMRLSIRFRLMKGAWWDDLLVTLAVATVMTGTIFICLSTNDGLGQHFGTLSTTQIEHYLVHFYVANAAYNMSTTLIKLSLLFQYLRVFEAGLARTLCITLIVLISCWGFAYSFMSWFPCFPVRAYWDWSLTDATCYAYGTKERAPFVAAFESHSALNMIFDIAVLIMPVWMIWRRDRSKREYVAIAGLFALGSVVVILSSCRLATIVAHQAGWKPDLDFTYYAPISIILACLEVDIAILAASMPIFWPVLIHALQPILVTQEVHVTSEPRYGQYQSSDVELDSDNASVHSDTELRHVSLTRKGHDKDSSTIERVYPVSDHPTHRSAEVQVWEPPILTSNWHGDLRD